MSREISLCLKQDFICFILQGKYPVSVAKDLRMPQFKIEMVTAKNCDNKIHMGNYSCLVAQFHLKRSISFHLIQNYLPSILIVAVSWVSFWMDIESVPGRISLGVITLLAVSNQATGTSVPQTSYVKVSLQVNKQNFVWNFLLF